MHDVIVLGAGVAGAAAAAFASKLGRRVCLVSRMSGGKDVRSVEWMSPKGAELVGELNADFVGKQCARVGAVTFWSSDLSKSAECKIEEAVSLVDRGGLRRVVLDLLGKAGVTFAAPAEVVDVEAGEDAVRLKCADGRVFAGRLLIAADGVDSLVVRRMRMSKGEAGQAFWCAEWQGAARKGKKQAKGAAALHVVLGTNGPLGFGAMLADAGGVTLRLSEPGEAATAKARMQVFSRQCAEHAELLAGNASGGAVSSRVVPRGASLEFDTHCAKRTLVIGEAGGFVAALSQEGLYPALASARIAAQIAHEALDARHPQDELSRFDAAWRSQLADHLRLPGTDLKLLMPLVFSKPAIAMRMARSFLLGENM